MDLFSGSILFTWPNFPFFWQYHTAFIPYFYSISWNWGFCSLSIYCIGSSGSFASTLISICLYPQNNLFFFYQDCIVFIGQIGKNLWLNIWLSRNIEYLSIYVVHLWLLLSKLSHFTHTNIAHILYLSIHFCRLNDPVFLFFNSTYI